jgi:hypothetical protein
MGSGGHFVDYSRRAFLGLSAAAIMSCAASPPPRAMIVHRSPSCGCCGGWVDHLRGAGFTVTERMADDLSPVAARLGVPDPVRSCHTGEIGGYFVEGHVPAADVERLLRERPSARGIAVPGMPIGSPGMEMGARRDAYDTLLVARDGDLSVFASHNR